MSAMFKKIFSILSILMLLVAGTPEGRAQHQEKIALQNPGFQEFFREAANISGAVVRGVQVLGRAVDGPTLIGYVPYAWRGSFMCAQVVSADGRYEAYGSYLVPETWPGGKGALDFPTSHENLLRSAPDDGLAVMVSEGDCRNRRTAELSFVLWNSQDIQTISLIVNAFNADEVFAYVGNDPVPIRCQRVEAQNNIAYDRKCNIDTALNSGLTKVEIYRLNHGRASEPIIISVWFPET